MLLVGGSGALSQPAFNSSLALRGSVAIPLSSRYSQMWLSRALESFSLQELKEPLRPQHTLAELQQGRVSACSGQLPREEEGKGRAEVGSDVRKERVKTVVVC